MKRDIDRPMRVLTQDARAKRSTRLPERIVLDSHHSLNVDDTRLAIRVLRGHVDLFALSIAKDVSKGQRHHLFRAEAGDTIFGLPLVGDEPSQRLGVIAVGSLNTEIILAKRENFEELDQIESWISRLSTTIVAPKFDWSAQEAEINRKYTLAAGDQLRAPSRRIVWTSIDEGEVRFVGASSACVAGDPPLPLAPGTWIEAGGDCSLSTKSIDAISANEIWLAIDRFHLLVTTCIAKQINSAFEAESDRLVARSNLARRRTNKIFSDLAGVISDRARDVNPAKGGADLLLEASREIGDAMGVAITRPPTTKAPDQDIAGVFEIARASHLRARRILLRANWWHQDIGALIAWRGSDHRPVAIIPTSRNRSALLDPKLGGRHQMTGAIAAELAAEGVMLYPALPPQVHSIWGLLKFGMVRTRSDTMRIFLSALFVGLLTLAIPLVTQALIDSVIPRAEFDQLVICAIALVIVALVSMGFQAMQGIAMLRLEGMLDWVLQSAIVDRLLRLPVLFFKQFSAGDLADRTLGIEAVRVIVTGRAVRGLLASVSCLFSFGLMFYFDPWLASIAAALAIVRGAMVLITSLIRLPHERINFDLQGRLRGLVLQFLSGVGKLRTADGTVHALAIWAAYFTKQKRHFIVSQRAVISLRTFEIAFPSIATLVIFAVAAHNSQDKLFHDMGAFLAFFAAFGQSLVAVGEWGAAVGELLIAIPRFGRLQPIISAAPEITEDRKAPGVISGAVELAQVSFRYVSGGPRILDNINLSVNKGEYVAIVGPSGSGKSTIFRLLLGFEKPEAGVIFFDGKAIETLDISAIRRQIGVVLQNSKLASGSLYENICGGVQLPLEQVWRAATLAGLQNDIEAMPMGIHTVIAEGVSTLSGGQRQRLMIARALVHHPSILLMDEATSALDNRTQAIVSASLAKLNVTRIVIAHRLSTVQTADRIVVLAGGRIVQTGSFSDLSAKPGIFADFTKRQLV